MICTLLKRHTTTILKQRESPTSHTWSYISKVKVLMMSASLRGLATPGSNSKSCNVSRSASVASLAPRFERKTTLQASWLCGPIQAQACNFSLSGGSLADFNITERIEQWRSSPYSTLPLRHTVSSEMLSEFVNLTALAELDLTPEGGISSSTGHMTVQNVCIRSVCKG